MIGFTQAAAHLVLTFYRPPALPRKKLKMEIQELWVYPIKSCRGFSMQEARLGREGFKHDRTFMLLKVNLDTKEPQGRKLTNMHIGGGFEKCSLFTGSLKSDDELLVEYRHPDGIDKPNEYLTIPLSPNTTSLEPLTINMHNSPTQGHDMGFETNTWFSDRFGFSIICAYLGSNKRAVLGTVSPNAAATKQFVPAPGATAKRSSWSSMLTAPMSYLLGTEKSDDTSITFADVAPFLVVSTKSLDHVSSLLSENETMDITKFRPNIVISGCTSSYDEDFWGQLTFGIARRTSAYLTSGILTDKATLPKIVLTHNCGRCASINVDYRTGMPGANDEGKILKKLMATRRVDKGTKYSPVFGRYGFTERESEGMTVRVGDKVDVSIRNTERTTFDWPGLTN